MQGATPKLTISASESICAPKRLSAPSMRAARPSSASNIAAHTIAATAACHSFSKAKRIAVRPEHNPPSVSALGMIFSMERSSRRSAAALRTRWILPFFTPLSQFRQHGFAGFHDLACRNRNPRPIRQVYIEPTAETNNAETFAPAHDLALPKIAFYAARDKPRDLHHGKLGPVFQAHTHRHALIIYACLVEGGVNEAPRPVGQFDDAPVSRIAVHMHIEDIHENAEPGARGLAHAEFRRRRCAHDGQQNAIRRADDEARAFGRLAVRIAEERHAPQCKRQEHEARPARH